MGNYIKISILIIITFLIFYIFLKLRKNKYLPMPVNISPEVLENGVLTDAEIKNLATVIKGKITGITIFGESEMLQSLLNISDIDLIRLYNKYLDLFAVSLYSDLVEEWYWSVNNSLFESVKQRFINLHINI